ncbi:MAG TPA: HAMP domain-containing protein [Kofleriaceae bacterium]|nr:HAMP domain-containing protein [Kofleriaceae bacterium]
MLDVIKRKLSLKVSLILALITIPPMVAAAYYITAREAANQEQLMIDSGKIAAMSGAQMYGAMLEAAIDGGLLTTGDLFDPVYEEIKGFDFGDNPRFHTRYDFYTDRVAVEVQDRIVDSSPNFLYAAGLDFNGYVPTHNTRFTQPLTGDRTKDLSGNRTKRKFTDPVAMAAVKNLTPVLVQQYKRDTGEIAWDVSAPITVKSQHFGGFRVGVSFTSIASHRRSLLLQLSIVFGALAIVTVGFIFLMLRRSMRPLEQLATVANEISSGEGLERPIKPGTNDEIGQMAKSLNRLRASLQAAMGRLGE